MISTIAFIYSLLLLHVTAITSKRIIAVFHIMAASYREVSAGLVTGVTQLSLDLKIPEL
jgi:hypothetical protein